MAGTVTSNISDSAVAGILEVNLDNANDDVLVYGNDGTTNRVLKTDTSGRLVQGCATATLTSVAASATSTTLIAANTARRGLAITNNSSSNLFVDISGGTASSSSFSVRLQAFSYFELPQPVCTGTITGIWTTATGAALVTEYT